LDVGGEDAGATVLAALADAFKGKNVDLLQVINPARPVTSTGRGCMDVRDRIERACRMKITGVVGNSNLIDDTSLGDIKAGHAFVRAYAKESGLPLKFITVPCQLLKEAQKERFSCPVLPIARQLVPPWKKAIPF
jgi:hypothetical protein